MFSKLMYLGRVVGVGLTGKGEPSVVYAVSGRSESSRQRKLVIEGDGVIRMASLEEPTQEQLEKKDIFFYPAIKTRNSGMVGIPQSRICDEGFCAIVSNGIQTDRINEYVDSIPYGNALSHLSLALSQLGHEEDEYKTPRIAGVSTPSGFDVLGIVIEGRGTSASTIIHKEDGVFRWVSTYTGGFDSGKYEVVLPTDLEMRRLKMHGRDAQELAEELYEWMNPELVVCAGAARFNRDERKWKWELGVKNRHDNIKEV
jgi:IMP cyclohydrolase